MHGSGSCQIDAGRKLTYSVTTHRPRLAASLGDPADARNSSRLSLASEMLNQCVEGSVGKH